MGLQILYLEDNATFAEQVCRMFLTGHNVSIVPSILSARTAMEAGSFDVLLADYDLEIGKGDQFVREFRRKNPKTPIIAVSSHHAGNVALKDAGASIICSKMEFDKIAGILAKLFPAV